MRYSTSAQEMEHEGLVVKSSKIEENLKTREHNIRRSIANITEAVATVVSHSTNDDFRQKCFSLMKVPNSSGLASSVSSQLHAIAHQRMGVTWYAESSAQELSQLSETPTPTISQASSSQFEDQRGTSQPTDFDDDFDEFSHIDFSDDVEITGLSETNPVPTEEETVTTATSNTEPFETIQVSTSSLGEDWFDEVLDSDLFLSES